jgi:signal peptidase II
VTAPLSTAARGRHVAARVMVPVAVLVVVLDQLTKWWALERLSRGRTIDLFWTLRFNLVRNAGAAFSTGRGLGPVLGVLAVVVVVVLVRMGRMAATLPTALGLGLVLGGALGNLTDRAFRSGSGGFLGGHVVDFVDLQWWPVFNLADSAIVVGGLLLAFTFATAPDDPGVAPAPTDAHNTGEHNTGEHSTGEHSTGEHSTGEHRTGEHRTGDAREHTRDAPAHTHDDPTHEESGDRIHDESGGRTHDQPT